MCNIGLINIDIIIDQIKQLNVSDSTVQSTHIASKSPSTLQSAQHSSISPAISSPTTSLPRSDINVPPIEPGEPETGEDPEDAAFRELVSKACKQSRVDKVYELACEIGRIHMKEAHDNF